MDLHKEIVEYLNAMVNMKRSMNSPKNFEYLGMEDFLLKNGKQFKSQKYPEKYKRWRGKKKECYTNAFNLAQSNMDLIYVEGVGISKSLPIVINHAFCVDKEGRVIDPTWDNQEEIAYFGVEFSRKYVYDTIMRKKSYGILDNYEERFPLYTGEHKNFKYV